MKTLKMAKICDKSDSLYVIRDGILINVKKEDVLPDDVVSIDPSEWYFGTMTFLCEKEYKPKESPNFVFAWFKDEKIGKRPGYFPLKYVLQKEQFSKNSIEEVYYYKKLEKIAHLMNVICNLINNGYTAVNIHWTGEDYFQRWGSLDFLQWLIKENPMEIPSGLYIRLNSVTGERKVITLERNEIDLFSTPEGWEKHIWSFAEHFSLPKI